MNSESVSSEHYTEEYYRNNCGGAEFYRLYGPRVVKPGLAYALGRAELGPGMRILDVGCGRGELMYQAAARGAWAVGVDYAVSALALAADNSHSSVALCDAKRLPFKDGSFDRIFFMGVMDHLHDWELRACFAEFARLLKPGGFVLANTCTNKQYYKTKTYGIRRALADFFGRRRPIPPRSSEDKVLHANEHDHEDLKKLLSSAGWKGEIEPRANDKYYVGELYGAPLPEDFPIKPAAPWKRAYWRLMFRGPMKRYLAREFFCKIRPARA